MTRFGITSFLRYLVVIAILCVITRARSHAQEWERLSADNSAVEVIDASTIVVVGDMGKIIRSDDGGEHWHTQRSNRFEDLHDVLFTDRLHGLIVGNGGVVLRSTDGGSRWHPVESATGRALTRIRAASATRMCVVGDSGTILVSNDGGGSWSPSSSGTVQGLYGIAFATESTGIAVGDSGTALRTTDGGETWSPIMLGASEFLSDVDFSDARNGIIVGNNEITFRTTDAGATWVQGTDISEQTTFYRIDMIDSLHAVAVGADARGNTVCVTSDGGASWISSAAGLPVSFAMIVKDVGFFDPLHGAIVGTFGVVATTADGGQSWVFRSFAPLIFPLFGNLGLFDAGFTGMDTICLAASEGGVLRTTDGGATWIDRHSPASDNLSGIHFFDGQRGIAFGTTFGTLLESNNAGESWSTLADVNGTKPDGLTTVHFLDRFTAHAVNNTTLYTITDFGRTWSARSFDGNEGIAYDVQFASHEVGFVLRVSLPAQPNDEPTYTVQRTLDSGKTWRTILTRKGSNESIQSLWFLDSLRGFVCAGAGFTGQSNAKLLRTTDGGRSWDSVLNGVPNLVNIRFFSPTSGLLVGAGSQVYMTTDGGATWNRERLWPDGTVPDSTFTFSRSAVAPDRRTVLVYGFGVIFRKQFSRDVAGVEMISNGTAPYRNPYLYLDIRPNPVTAKGTHITVYGLYSVRDQQSTLGIYDILGRRVLDLTPAMQLNGTGTMATVDLSGRDLPVGMYLLTFRAGADSKTERIFIAR